jgi:uncharacterized membrane protein YfcA
MMARERRKSLPEPLMLLVLVGASVVASVVAGVAGFGAGIILLPVLAWIVGVKAAVPVLTITMLLGNISRVWWSRGDVDRAVAVRFVAGAIPASALGAVIYAGSSSEGLSRVIGLFLLVGLPLRRLLITHDVRVRLSHFPLLGAAFGALSSLVVTTGPVMTPFFLAYGLRRGAYIATDSVCAFAMHIARGAAFARLRVLTWESVAVGLLLGLTMFLGSWIGRRLLDRMSDRFFLVVIEGLVLIMGLHFLLVPR